MQIISISDALTRAKQSLLKMIFGRYKDLNHPNVFVSFLMLICSQCLLVLLERKGKHVIDVDWINYLNQMVNNEVLIVWEIQVEMSLLSEHNQ